MPTHKGKTAKIYDRASMHDNASMHDRATMFDNASMYDYAIMFDNARMCNSASLHDHASLHDRASLFGRASMRGRGVATRSIHIASAGGVGSDAGTLTAHPDTDCGIRVNRDCFTGTVEEFLAANDRTHANDHWLRTYPLILHGLVAAVYHALVAVPIVKTERHEAVDMLKVTDALAAVRDRVKGTL